MLKNLIPPILSKEVERTLKTFHNVRNNLKKEGFYDFEHYIRYLHAKDYINSIFNISTLLEQQNSELKQIQELRSLLEL